MKTLIVRAGPRAIKHLRENGANPSMLLDVFGVKKSAELQKLAVSMLKKTVKVFYFDRETGSTSDISALDPSADASGEWGWGGLSEFSGRANQAVARAVANNHIGE